MRLQYAGNDHQSVGVCGVPDSAGDMVAAAEQSCLDACWPAVENKNAPEEVEGRQPASNGLPLMLKPA